MDRVCLLTVCTVAYEPASVCLGTGHVTVLPAGVYLQVFYELPSDVVLPAASNAEAAAAVLASLDADDDQA